MRRNIISHSKLNAHIVEAFVGTAQGCMIRLTFLSLKEFVHAIGVLPIQNIWWIIKWLVLLLVLFLLPSIKNYLVDLNG
jgi:hypothetical protein